MTTAAQRRLARAASRIGQSFGTTDTWTQYRASGDGITAARSVARVGTLTGSIVQQLPSAIAVALAGANVPKATWWLITADAVMIGDAIKGTSDTSLIYTIETVDRYGGAYLCRLSVGGATA